MRKKLKPDEITGIIFFVLSAAMICASALFLCRESDIWYDEMFTLGLANQSLGELISITAGDVHPPLYYMIVKLFLTIGGAGGLETQITLAKLASVFSFGLCVLLSAVKIRKNFGLFASGVFSFLLVSMPQLSGYLVEMRMYGRGPVKTGFFLRPAPLRPATPIILPVWRPAWSTLICS